MDQKSSSPNALPPSVNRFWDGVVETHDMDRNKTHKHYFDRVGSREIKCECGFGLFIGEGDDVKDGDLYHFGEKVF